MKGSLFIISILLVIVSLPSLAFAAPVTVFEETFMKPVGKPVTYERSFTLPANVESCQLVVKNGADGSNAVQNVYVWVNGVQAFGHRDFKKATKAETEVALDGTNTITVALQGQGSTFISLEIVGTEKTITPPPRQFF